MLINCVLSLLTCSFIFQIFPKCSNDIDIVTSMCDSKNITTH